MQAPPPNQNHAGVPATPNHAPSPSRTKPDVEMIDPAAAAAAAPKIGNPLQFARSWSSSPPVDPPASQPSKPAPASVAPVLSDGRPALPLGVGGRASPVENKKGTMRPPASTAPGPSRAAVAAPNAAPPHLPQAASAPRPDAPAFNPPTQSRPAHPGASLPNMTPANPPAQHAQTMAPTPSSENQPRAPTHTLPSNRITTPVQNHAAHRPPSDQFSGSVASPASSQQTPFREPHTPSALDPYTLDNIYTGGGFYLPDGSDSQLDLSAYVDQCNRLYAVLRTMHPSVVRRVIRDTWQTSLAGSEAHISFVLNVVTHKCTAASARVAVGKFGKEFVKEARWELMSQFTPAILAEMEDLVVEKAPDSLLDKAMAKRLGDIPAKPLLNMLARAERLGYDENDIIGEQPGQAQKTNNYSWTPTAQPGLEAQPGTQPGAQPGGQSGVQPGAQPSPPPPRGGGFDPLTCPLCHRRYVSAATRDHHWKKRICQKPPAGTSYVCHRCDQSFATTGGLEYHRRNKVCGDDGANPAPAAAASPNLMASSAGSSPASFTPARLPSMGPHAQHANRASPVSTPARPSGQGTPNAAGPPPGTRVTPVYPPPHTQPTPGPKPAAAPAGSQTPTYDPYAHLSEERHNNMLRELAEAEVTYSAKMDNVRQTISDPIEQARKLDSLKNSFATKQSMVRKKYGVRLRERRSKAVLEEQRKRMGVTPTQSSQVPRVRSPPGSSGAPPSKRARTSMDERSMATQGHAVQETPTRKHAASADVAAPLSGGLAAAAAAPETMDPTRLGGLSAGRPPAYGGSPHGSVSQARPRPTPAKPRPPVNSSVKSLMQPSAIEVSSNTDTDSDSDDDTIPAQLPPPPLRASLSLSKPAR